MTENSRPFWDLSDRALLAMYESLCRVCDRCDAIDTVTKATRDEIEHRLNHAHKVEMANKALVAHREGEGS